MSPKNTSGSPQRDPARMATQMSIPYASEAFVLRLVMRSSAALTAG